jgi:phospholipase/lecithinase/hemolysin
MEANMNLRPFITLFTAVILSVTWGSAAVAQGRGIGRIKEIHVFGDSLSDNGNLFTASGFLAPPSPPYFDGRFSNGPVWVEYLDDMLPGAELNDFAFGGAFSDTRNVNAPSLPGVLPQVAVFLGTNPKLKRRDLCIVWSGANNYIFEPVISVPSMIVDDVSTAIQQLAWAGCQSFLIPNLPNIGESPFGIAFGLQELLALKVAAHNGELAEEVDILRQELGIAIILLDVNTLFGRTLAGQLGFVNGTVPCLVTIAEVPTPTGACPVDDTGQIEMVAPGTLFMDGVHPTTAAHRLIAAFAFGALGASQGSQIVVAGVDEPVPGGQGSRLVLTAY